MKLRETGIEPLDQYCEGVIDGSIPVCKWVRLAVQRHYRDLQRAENDPDFPYYFEPAACMHYVNFFAEELQHYDGIHRGKPIIFEPWQYFVWGSPFGWLKDEKLAGFHIRRFRNLIIIIPKKQGKALDINTRIPTPDGWKTMEDLAVGNRVFDEDGRPCKVIATTPVQYDRPCYRLTFSDGTSVVADENHEWVTSSAMFRDANKHRDRFQEPIRTTREIYETFIVGRSKKESYKYIHHNHRIHKSPCLETAKKDLDIDPYILGLWLGDGSNYAANITVGNRDLEIIDYIEKAGYSTSVIDIKTRKCKKVTISSRKPDNLCCRGHKKVKHWSEGRLYNRCRECERQTETARRRDFDVDPVIYKALSTRLAEKDLYQNKRIPIKYLRSSNEQRLELLRGLMDSDGHCTKAGQCEFTSTNKKLASDTTELIRTLGLKVRISEHDATLNGRVTGSKFRVQFYAYSNMPVFKLQRKKRRQKKRPKNRTRNYHRQIISVEPVESRPVKCIQVDSLNNMYLCGDGFIETHNSIIIAGTMLYMLDWDGWPGAQIYALAKNRSHAEKLGYRDAEKMVKNSEELQAHYTINKGAAHRGIYCEQNDSFIQPLTSKPESTDGLKVHMSGNDEVKDWTDWDMYNIMKDGTAANANSLIADITTAGDDRTSIGYEKQEELKKILEGTYRDEQTFGVIYTISKEDREAFTEALALEDPYPAVVPIIKKANPNYGVSVNADYYRGRVNDAQKKEKEKNKFLTKHLDIWINAMDNYFTITSWINECADPETIVPSLFKGKPCYLHLDMSSKKDICSLMALFRCGRTEDGKRRYAAFGHHFLPEAVVSENLVGRRAEYNAWAENDCFILTPGNVTDYAAIKECIKRYNGKYNVLKVGFDDWNSIQLNEDLRKLRMRGVEIKQNTKNLSEPMKTLEAHITYRRPSEDGKGIAAPRILHNGDPVLQWAMSNVVAKEDANENVYPRKEHEDAKIDPAVALINLFALEAQQPLPAYGTRKRIPKVWKV